MLYKVQKLVLKVMNGLAQRNTSSEKNYIKVNLICLPTEKKLMDMNRLVVAEGEGEGVGWTRSLELVDANYCIWTG